MRSLAVLAALAVLGLSAPAAVALPGDPRVVQGTLEWPSSLGTEPFVVIRGDDGRLYYADIASGQKRTTGSLGSGSRVAVLGVEGNRSHEIAAIAYGAGDAASLGLALPSAPPPSASPAAGPSIVASSPPEPMWRLDGTVQRIADHTVAVRTQDGQTHSVDMSRLSETTIRALKPGDRISLFGVPQRDRRLVANGFIQSEPSPPSASPRSLP
jgi:hypothetical protein